MVKVVFFIAADTVGLKILKSLSCLPKERLALVISNPNFNSEKILDELNLQEQVIHSGTGVPPWRKIEQSISGINSLLGFSWFPHIFPKDFINIFERGILNLHNSYLPYNRGRHSTFWGIYYDTPFGASLHWVDSQIDHGNIVDQIQVSVPKFANASTIYGLQLDACVKLAHDFIPKLLSELPAGQEQDSDSGSHHYSKEIEQVTRFKSSDQVSWSEVVKLIRATSTDSGSLSIEFQDGDLVKIWGKVINS
jgi:methionyl-tRNA formyltransferase